MDNTLFQIRVTGILIENQKILLVKQKTSGRDWSLPGGRAEAGELLDQAIIRELYEETGLIVKVIKLLYLCDKPDNNPPILHVTFLLERLRGELTLPSNEFDKNPIHDVRFVHVPDLEGYGFTKKFIELIQNGFIDAGNYRGLKANIGL